MPNEDVYRYCMVQYSFKSGVEKPVNMQRLHGNTKSATKPYIRTWSSTKGAIENAVKDLAPREVIHKVVSDDLGGLASCSGLGQMPRNRQQVKDIGKAKKGETCLKNLSGNDNQDDPWYRLLGDCKKQSNDRKTAFLRDVRVAPEPLCVMATDRQLKDLERFCCNPTEFRPFTVDPTFNIGRFNVTPITYEHLMLENKRDGNHPSLIGPVLLHEKKTTETYSTFGGVLRTLEPNLRDVMAFGTDDEKALVDGFKNNFDRSVHLLCELHLKKNIEAKLKELGIVGEVKSNITADIFGKTTGSIRESGLNDAEDEEKFKNMLLNLNEKWSTLHKNGKVFHEWFQTRKSQEFLASVIKPVRQRAGLGCPPVRFTTNRSERTNRLIQEFINSESQGKTKVDEFFFCVSLAKLVKTQRQEVELALVGCGEYKLREKFKHLEVSAEKWGKMVDAQRTKIIEKVHTATLEDASVSSAGNISQFLSTCEEPVMQEMLRGGIDWIPREILATMVNKAMSLMKKPKAITCQSSNTIIVESTSNPRMPHIVNVFPNGKIECTNCPGFAASSVCKHTIAASVQLQRMDQFIRWLVKTYRSKGGVNFSKAITYGMPSGRGKKGNRPPRKRGKKVGCTTTTVSRVSDAAPGQQQSSEISGNTSPACHIDQFLTPQPTAIVSQQQPSISPLSQECGYIPMPMQLVTQHMPTGTSSPSPAFESQTSAPIPQVQASFPRSPYQQQSFQIQRQSVPFPNPNFGQFLIYLLHFCPAKTSMCFGCGNPLRQSDSFPQVTQDLVLVSKMLREWSYQGRAQSKIGNVYFHCDVTCVRRKKPDFDARLCVITPEIDAHLQQMHRDILRRMLGV